MEGQSGQVAESSLAVFMGDYCQGEEVVTGLARENGLRVIEDREVVTAAASLSGLPGAAIARTFSSKRSVFDKFTHEKRRSLAYLRLGLAELMAEPRLLITGYVAHLIPWEITHMLRACLIADMPFRVRQACQEENIVEQVARARINAADAEKADWTSRRFEVSDPWDSALYDILVPMGKISTAQAVELISDQLDQVVVQPSEMSRQALTDFQMASRASVALVRAGHDGMVTSQDGALTVIIKMKVLMFNRLQEELQAVLSPLPGVKSVRVEIDPEARYADIYRKYDQTTPSKVLLVDDEKEFVQTLSERLIFRNMGTAVAYDGQSALEMLVDDDPDVLVLDLKMPGIDGIEVLRRVKKIRPLVDVIILTGHGSEDDRKTCMELGAFAYLHKPVDIDLLSSKLKEAHERVRNRKSIS